MVQHGKALDSFESGHSLAEAAGETRKEKVEVPVRLARLPEARSSRDEDWFCSQRETERATHARARKPVDLTRRSRARYSTERTAMLCYAERITRYHVRAFFLRTLWIGRGSTQHLATLNSCSKS